jgi:hypothetical protein
MKENHPQANFTKKALIWKVEVRIEFEERKGTLEEKG